MPSATTSRRATHRSAKTAKAAPAGVSKRNANISTFARVSKRNTVEKELVEKIAAVETVQTATIPVQPPSSKKRKAVAVQEVDEIVAAPASTQTSRQAIAPRGSAKRACRRTAREATPDVDFSGALLERLKLQSPRSTRTSSPITVSTPATSIVDSDGDIDCDVVLPQELIDLVNLHVALFKTLTLHYAHHGTNSPVDLRVILPGVTRAWGKRKVTAEDIRRCVGVLDAKSPIFVADYGRGKLCIEMHQDNSHGPINENTLSQAFEHNLQARWSSQRSASSDIVSFLRSLPMAPIKPCESAVKISPMLAKGQRTLQELKNGIFVKKEEKEAKAQATSTTNPDGSKMSLLDRIRFKQLQQAQEPSCPSREELERRAALQRVDDIAAVISMLSRATSMGQQRISFTMPALLQKLKDSLRLPISREEGTACIRILAKEITPEWMRIVTIGGKENVVVQVNFQPSKAVIQERVKNIGA